MNIRDIPAYDRPREKARRSGIESLSDDELLSLLIQSGIKGSSAIEIASKLLTLSGGLDSLKDKSLKYLRQIKGLGYNHALILIACFEINRRIAIRKTSVEKGYTTALEMANNFRPLFRDGNREALILVTLSEKLKIIAQKLMYLGTSSETSFSSKEILQEVLFNGGKRYVLIHNHPSGNILPSAEDMLLTSKIKKESEVIALDLYDHIIVSHDSYFSFRENKLIK